MSVCYLDVSNAGAVVGVYNRGSSGLPGIYAMSPKQFAMGVQNDMAWFDGISLKELENEQLVVWREAGRVSGFAHVATQARQQAGDCEIEGLIRFLDFAPNQRHVGQTLLDEVERFLREAGAAQIRAFPKSYIYHFFAPDGGIPERYSHTTDLLGANGYAVVARTKTMMWMNFAVAEPVPPQPQVKVNVKQNGGETAPPGLFVTVHTPDANEDDSFGMCIAHSLQILQPSEQGRSQLFIHWLVTDEAWRGQGWGRYLMQRTLWEAQQLGYRDTILCTAENNHRAVLLYTSLGYQAVQTSYAFTKRLRSS